MRTKGNNIKKGTLKMCFTSSSGGHFEQLVMLAPLMKKYNSIIVTEKINYKVAIDGCPVLYVPQINRTDKLFVFKFAVNFFKSFFIVLKNRPDLTVSTGALASIPIMIWTKVFGGKVIYIESFAKIDTPNISGKIAYKFADQFYIQWENLRQFYPNAIYKGGIY